MGWQRCICRLYFADAMLFMDILYGQQFGCFRVRAGRKEFQCDDLNWVARLVFFLFVSVVWFFFITSIIFFFDCGNVSAAYCWRVLFSWDFITLASATAGKVSQASSCSSPRLPWRWPRSIRAAVAVATPIPSPTKYTIFFAWGLWSAVYCSRFLNACLACSYQYSWSATKKAIV